MSKIVLEDIYENAEDGTITYYFTAPKELLSLLHNGDCKNAKTSEISIEFPKEHIEPRYASVEISPTAEIDGCMTDYDWQDISVPYSNITELINLAREEL